VVFDGSQEFFGDGNDGAKLLRLLLAGPLESSGNARARGPSRRGCSRALVLSIDSLRFTTPDWFIATSPPLIGWIQKSEKGGKVEPLIRMTVIKPEQVWRKIEGSPEREWEEKGDVIHRREKYEDFIHRLT